MNLSSEEKMIDQLPLEETAFPVGAARPVAGTLLRLRPLWSTLDQVCEVMRVPLPERHGRCDVLFQHLRFKPGQRLNVTGSAFGRLYLVRGGFLKTVMIDDCGSEQVLGFPMRGDVLGIDGISEKRHTAETVCLTDCDLIAMPFHQIIAIEQEVPGMQDMMCSVISRELARDQKMIGMLSTYSAEARVARFLVNLSERYAALGFSAHDFTLQMTRRDIGSYLGLTLETISRTLNAFKNLQFIDLAARKIQIKDEAALRHLRRFAPNSLNHRRAMRHIGDLGPSETASMAQRQWL
ncbi:MAG: helix-turn-helix domain-containing protein [Pseudomonadota bacterium]